jgi:hypothetical protein
MASRRLTGCFRGLGARERLPQTFDRLGETCNLLGHPLGIGLLRGEKALHALQLVLNDLQLVDRFLLGDLEVLGLLDKPLGGLRGPRLQLAGRNDAVLFGRGAGVGAPERNCADAKHDHEESPGRERNRLRADTGDTAGPCISGCDFAHGTSKPAGKGRFPNLPQAKVQHPAQTGLGGPKKLRPVLGEGSPKGIKSITYGFRLAVSTDIPRLTDGNLSTRSHPSRDTACLGLSCGLHIREPTRAGVKSRYNIVNWH